MAALRGESGSFPFGESFDGGGFTASVGIGAGVTETVFEKAETLLRI